MTLLSMLKEQSKLKIKINNLHQHFENIQCFLYFTKEELQDFEDFTPLYLPALELQLYIVSNETNSLLIATYMYPCYKQTSMQ